MKNVFRFTLYLILGFAGGIGVSIIAQETRGVSTDTFYLWLSIILTLIAAMIIVMEIIQQKRLLIVVEDYTRFMDEDAFDVYRYNKFNESQMYSTIAFTLSLLALGIGIMHPDPSYIVLISGAVYIIAVFITLRSAGLINKIYPERDFPSPMDKKYPEKLLDMSDEGERHIMLNGLYKAYNMTHAALFFGILVIITYSILTGESQIFSILVMGGIMMISQMKYAEEIRET